MEHFERLDHAQGKLAHADRHGLVSRAAAHVGDDRQEDGERDHLGQSVLVQGDDARRGDVEQDVDAQPREPSARTDERRHAAQLLAADDADGLEMVLDLVVGHGLSGRGSLDDPDQPAVVRHHGHAEEGVVDEELHQALERRVDPHRQGAREHDLGHLARGAGEDDVSQPQDPHQLSGRRGDVDVLHVVVRVLGGITAQLVEHLPDRAVLRKGQELGDHEPAGDIRRILAQETGVPSLLRIHRGEHRLGLEILEAGDQVGLIGARQHVENGCGLGGAERLDELGGLGIGNILDELGRRLGSHRRQNLAALYAVEVLKGPCGIGARQRIDVLLQALARRPARQPDHRFPRLFTHCDLRFGMLRHALRGAADSPPRASPHSPSSIRHLPKKAGRGRPRGSGGVRSNRSRLHSGDPLSRSVPGSSPPSPSAPYRSTSERSKRSEARRVPIIGPPCSPASAADRWAAELLLP